MHESPTVFCYIDPVYSAVIVENGTSAAILLQCEIISGNPKTGSFSWYLNDSPVDLNATTGTMTVHEITDRTSGKYTCLIDNGQSGAQCIRPYIIGMFHLL